MSQDIAAIFDLLTFILRDLQSRETSKTFFACRGPPAQQLLDIIQELLDLFPASKARPILYKALLRLSHESDLHPTCFALPDLQTLGQQLAAGGFGDIWKSLLGGHSVSVKVMRFIEGADIQALLKQFGREALIWRQFSHPNLLPFYGLYYVENRLCLVSPWMENGHILKFLRNAPADTNRVSLILDVALGLHYLHREHIVHGDLKGPNILVTPCGRACLADFGLSSSVDALTLQFTHSTSTARAATPRYQAPELLQPELNPKNDFASDVYAFACVCYEILTGKAPFFEIKFDITVGIKVLQGLRPSRPDTIPHDDSIWLLLQDCWKEKPADRGPDVAQIIERLVNPPIGAKPTQSTTDWDVTFSSKFRCSMQEWPLLPSVTGIERQIFGDEFAKACRECFPERYKAAAPENIDTATWRRITPPPSDPDTPIATVAPGFPQNFALYVLSLLDQRSDRRSNGFRSLMKQWETWDILTSLMNYRSVVEILFGFLSDADSPGNT
ncbi:kinase-like domain-containing protein, partial [Mycena epipterygia]